MASSERYPVSVKINFHIQGDKSSTQTERTFDASKCEPAQLGLAEGATPTKPEAGDYSYSGMHDHGPLPAPKEGGDIAQLIGCVEATKRFSDEFLTDVIKKEKAHHPSPKQGGNPKRPKKTS